MVKQSTTCNIAVRTFLLCCFLVLNPHMFYCRYDMSPNQFAITLAEYKCCRTNLDTNKTCGNETLIRLRKKYCGECGTTSDLASCRHFCNDCDEKKYDQAQEYYKAELYCCKGNKKFCAIAASKNRSCSKCETSDDLADCTYTCGDCDGKKKRQEYSYHKAEEECCKKKTKDCPNTSKNRPCSRCKTWIDFYNCPHTCDDCDMKKQNVEYNSLLAEKQCCNAKLKDCPNAYQNRSCKKCETMTDFFNCPHTCDNCDGRKLL